MPRLSVWTIRASLLYLGAGFTLGGLMLFNKGVPLASSLWKLLPVHVEFVLLGWTMQLAMGVAFWILPRLRRQERYGNITLARIAFVLLNGGIAAVSLGEWLDGPDPLTLAGRSAELLAAFAFAVYIWPRVKTFGG